MAVSTTNRKAGPFVGNDATTVFPFTFKVFDAEDLLVVLTDDVLVENTLILDTDYTVILNGDQDDDPGGSVTLTTALVTGTLLTITSQVAATQTVVLTSQGGFYPNVINRAFDKLTIIAQQLVETVGRTIRLPLSSTANGELPVPSPNALLAWNGTGDGFANIDITNLVTAGAYGTARVETFVGDGDETDFDLAFSPGTASNVLIFIGGVAQVPGPDFALVAAQRIRFTEAPYDGAPIQVRYYTGGVVPASDDLARIDGSNVSATTFRNAIAAVGTAVLAAVGGSALVGTRDSDTVQSKLDLLGAPPALLPEKFYLTNAMTAAEITDAATQAGTINFSTKINALLAEADGREVMLPNDARLRCDAQLGRVTAAGTTFTPGTKLIGGHDTILDSRVNNAALIRLATSASNRFQDDVVLANLQIKAALGGVATERDGISLERIVRAKLYNLYMEDVYRGLHVLIDENDVGGSNQILVDRLSAKRAIRWGVDIDPVVGANDLSYLTITGSQFNQCGVDERRAITGIALGATTTITTAVAHGFTTGEYVTIYNAGTSLDAEVENWTDIITVTGANTYTIPRNTTGRTAYSGTGATAMRYEPLSGSIRSKSQMAMFGPQTWITESRNVGILIPYGGGGVGAYKSTINKFTVENCPGVPIIANNVDGLTIENCDLRFNEALGGASLATIRLDATRAGVKGVRIRNNTIIGFNPSGPNSPHIAHSAQQSGATGLDDIIIENEIYKDYSDTNHTRYGAGLFTAQKITVIEDGRPLYAMRPFFKTQFSTANPTYLPDIRKGSRHIVVLEAGVTGTFTLGTPPNYGAGNATRNGQDFELTLINASGGTLNLAYSIPTSGAPTTIANGVTKFGKWSFAAQTAWVQSAAWF